MIGSLGVYTDNASLVHDVSAIKTFSDYDTFDKDTTVKLNSFLNNAVSKVYAKNI